MKQGLFDVIPLQRHFRNIVSFNAPPSEIYGTLRGEIPRLMIFTHKKLDVIRKEIKHYTFGDSMTTQIVAQREAIQEQYSKRFEDFVIDYEKSWTTHDNFSLKLGQEILDFLNRKTNQQTFLKIGSSLIDTATTNDINLHLFTFALQPIMKQHFGENVPCIFPFEFILSEDSLFLSHKDFSDKYSYGDKNQAEDIKNKIRGFNVQQLERIADDNYLRYRCSNRDNSFYWMNRLAYWEGFEEPRRRLSVLYGIFDYFFRETLFLIGKQKGSFSSYTHALEIPMDKFIKEIKSISTNGTS